MHWPNETLYEWIWHRLGMFVIPFILMAWWEPILSIIADIFRTGKWGKALIDWIDKQLDKGERRARFVSLIFFYIVIILIGYFQTKPVQVIVVTPDIPIPTPDLRGKGECNIPPKEPCLYLVAQDDTATIISSKLFGNPNHAEIILEIHRDSNGYPMTYFRTGDLITIPIPGTPKDQNFYKTYLGYEECNSEVLILPCWLVSKGEAYEELSQIYFNSSSQNVIANIQKANATEYDNATNSWSYPPTINEGGIVILPANP